MLTLYSPAKINLFLKIIQKRKDGYHDLASLFQAIDLHDTLHFELSEKDDLICDDLSLPTDSNNLIIKAANLFRQKTSFKFGLKVHLVKKIPSQAGLGGGSSNAATTLWALNQFFHQPVSLQELSQWGTEIGSDVSFFFSEGTAFCTGRGEQLSPLKLSSPKTDLWIIKPEEGLSTPEVFKALQLSDKQPIDVNEIYSRLSQFQQEPKYFNDLEKPAFERLPKLAALKNLLISQGFETVVMSGSGSAFFCLGKGVPPSIPGLFTAHSSFINREMNQWYMPTTGKSNQ